MGHQMHQMLATLCVILSHALGGSDPTWWVLPLDPELWQTPQWISFWIWLSYPVM
jgi:hypothetical protein